MRLLLQKSRAESAFFSWEFNQIVGETENKIIKNKPFSEPVFSVTKLLLCRKSLISSKTFAWMHGLTKTMLFSMQKIYSKTLSNTPHVLQKIALSAPLGGGFLKRRDYYNNINLLELF